MANIEGQFVTSQYESGRVVTDLRDRIYLLNKGATPFLTFGQKLEGEDTSNMQFEWFEDDFLTWTDTAKSAAASDATTVYVNNADRYAVDHVIWNQTSGERLLVTSVVSGSSYILVSRAFGETAAATVLANDNLVILGTAANEGAEAGNFLMTAKTSVYNYCQELRTPYEMTLRAINTETRTGDAWSFESMKAAEEHKLQIEKALLFGERKKLVASTKERYATRGLKPFIAAANVFNVGGPLPEADFEDFIRAIFRSGSSDARSDTKIGLFNDRLLAAVNRYPKAKVMIDPGDKSYGMNISTYVTPFGNLKLVHHRLLDTVYSNVGYGLIFDPANVKLRYFKEGRTKLFKNIKTDNNPTVRKDEYITTVGLEVRHASTHGEITNVTM